MAPWTNTRWGDLRDKPSFWAERETPDYALCAHTQAELPWALLGRDWGGDKCHRVPTLPLPQHIGLPMFAADRKPKRIHLMSLGVLNLPRNPLLDWSFGHSLISCHVEHHLFPSLSDNMCLKVR